MKVDSEKTTLAFVNLLNNAIRFSEEGSEIVIGALEQGDKVMAWVQDNGMGIPPDRLQKIFEEFYQIEPPNTRRYRAGWESDSPSQRDWSKRREERSGRSLKVWVKVQRSRWFSPKRNNPLTPALREAPPMGLPKGEGIQRNQKRLVEMTRRLNSPILQFSNLQSSTTPNASA